MGVINHEEWRNFADKVAGFRHFRPIFATVISKIRYQGLMGIIIPGFHFWHAF
jgi:hypothetical protein